MDTFKIIVPLQKEYFTTVRLTTGGICAAMEFDVDSTEDVKVCVTESLLILKRNGYRAAEVSFSIGETLACRLTGVGEKKEKEEDFADGISFALLEALIGGVRFEKDGQGDVQEISFEA